MRVIESFSTNACRNAIYRAYLAGCLHAGGPEGDRPAHWWGLCAALSSYYLAGGVLVPGPRLWAELSAFLLVPDDVRAVGLLAEYAVYRDAPAEADIELLGVELNEAIRRAPEADARVRRHLHAALQAPGPSWLALLSHPSFCLMRRLARDLTTGPSLPLPGETRPPASV